MENEAQNQNQNQQPQGQPPAGEQQPQGQQPQQQKQEQSIPYSRFKEVNDQLTALKAQIAQQQQAQQSKQQEEQSLADRLKKMEDDLQSERRTNLRLSVATAKSLPAELAERLRGETREALEQDADSLLALMKPKSGPGVPPPGGRAAKLDITGMTPAEIRKARAEGKL
jgi:predicted RNase H-like nuclease (RuvC/YqgF family)